MKRLSTGIVILIGAIFLVILIGSIPKGGTEGVVLDNENFTEVSVQADNGRVSIFPAQTNSPSVELSNNEKGKYKLHTKVKGDKLEVELRKKWFQWVSINFGINSSPHLTVYLPEKQFENIEAQTDNGRISIEDIKVEQLSADTDNGKIFVRNVQGTDIKTRTDNGSVELEDIIGNIDTKTDNGSVTLENITGNIKSKTDNGKITLITETLDRDIDLKTDNGAIDIKTKTEPTNATINIKKDNGKVTVFGETFYDTVIGEGENQINIETDNGRVRIESDDRE
ncbi:DUF4097 family beta strand repeat-containing protein [Ornithinibacillus halophilus]|uniref:DUF4097 and DUF4098 domain-containing protein YvlB n=1 Tax=Ornithinibacillus halophilus TaxID=930117 RepID=A0A1M5HKD0_9BACI|nr:DUF4097 family beta strand repeat-containing protein [Ornithinibacillus halophilus]SHG16400.1 DUF4097 and DUF4098 domain-containing protein YvlB [Ornithinibacillus halophilus]